MSVSAWETALAETSGYSDESSYLVYSRPGERLPCELPSSSAAAGESPSPHVHALSPARIFCFGKADLCPPQVVWGRGVGGRAFG